MAKLFTVARRFAAQEAGANLVEYGILIGLVALACFSAVTVIGQSVKEMFKIPGF